MPSERERASARRCGAVLAAVYVALAAFVLTEQWGRATSDTRLELTEAPGRYLAGTFSLWNPDVSLGELQNQAYGYLFPQGSFFALLVDGLGVPGWLTQRLWSVLVLVIACEGVRRLARVLGSGPWPAAVAGFAYGLSPRHVTELGTRSAEVLPGAVIPWALLPIVLAIQGRLRPRNAAVLSAAAFACSGGVNGTATAAPAALLAVVVGWAVLTRRLGWRFAAGWFALLGAVSAWWVLSLLRLGAYSPPFFDYVEDAPTTTSTAGFSAVLRGASNWVGYLTVGGQRWWPAGYELAGNPWLVLGTGVLAALGVVGLLRMRAPWRTPLLLAAALGVVCQTIAHTGTLDGPLSQTLQDLLDGPLAPLRNVPKADPILRVPLALGLAVLVGDLGLLLSGGRAGAPRALRPRARRAAAAGVVLALAGCLLASATPVVQAETRTPGWDTFPSWWKDSTAYLAKRADRLEAKGAKPGATWTIPGAGFGIQRWGWTMEEPMQAVARTPWVTRSQVPLTPAATIRMLTSLESVLESGAGSPYLRHMLNRVGIDTVLLRHDLDTDVAQVPPASLVGVALARSPGLRRVATFGHLEFGPAIEVYAVEPAVGARIGTGGYDVRDVDDAVTVASSVEDVIGAVGAGRVGPTQPMVVAGEPGWHHDASIVGDGFRRRERAFGQIHSAESNVMARGEPYRGDRVVPNYPGPAGAEPVVASYSGIDGVTASSSRGWANTFGAVHPEEAPWSALDGDASTFWRPAPYLAARGQWLRIDLGRPRPIGAVTLQEPVSEAGLDRVLRWRVRAGGQTRLVASNPLTGRAEVDLGGVRADSVLLTVDRVPSRQAAVGLAEVKVAGVTARRSLVVPTVPTDGVPDLLFSAAPEARACVTTLLGPDCDRHRGHASDEATGIDRTFTTTKAGVWRARGLVVARSRPGTLALLRPLGGVRMDGSSWLGSDPTVSPRMAYDGDTATSWVADPRDPAPELTVDLGRRRTVRRLVIQPPAGVAVAPDHAVVRARTARGHEERTVDLTGYGGFAPLRARRLTVTFSRTSPVVGNRPLGIAELLIPGGHATIPLEGAGRTGSVCGLGPELSVDGHTVPTRVKGRIGDVVAAGQLAVVPCGGRGARAQAVRLAAGEHHVRLSSTEQFQPVGLALTAARPEPAAPEPSRSLHLVSADDTRVELDVGHGEDAILSTPHNLNAGWVATLGGHRLEPITVDGWAQGWLVPAGLAGRVHLDYSPQRSYLVGLLGGLGVLGLVLAWALGIGVAALVRRRGVPGQALRKPPTPVGRGEPGGHAGAAARSRGRRSIVLGAAVVLAGGTGWLLGGPVVGFAAALGLVLSRWPRLVEAVVALGLVGAVVVLAVVVADRPQTPPAAVDLVTGGALGLAVAAGLTQRRAARERGRE
ncbi:MAG TPA: alpha-(1-_3)-arabinofuranosyltransferase family protein [Nocardioides sp.]|nr:alpha-(1->3)-arabinofuranosyltransferase family protein [Nocardioides sp.]